MAEDGAAASERDPYPRFDRLETDSRPCAVQPRPVIPEASRKRNPLGNGQSERKENELSIMLDEANAYERGMDDDLTFQTVRELAGTAYMAGRSAPPTAVEIEAVAKKLLWWDMAPAWEDVMPSEDCFWTLAEPEMRANYLRDAREMLEIARKAVSE